MKLAFLSTLLLPSVLSTSFGSNSVVITSGDVFPQNLVSLTPGAKYRIYAVYSSSAPNDAYAKNVVIKGAENVQFNVADLAKAKFNTGYVLDDSKVLAAPITISNNNGAAASRVPFSVYIVSVTKPVSPVVSAQLVNGKVDCSVAKISAASCTVLSAEKQIQVSGIEMSTTDSVAIKSAGFDSLDTGLYTDALTVLTVPKSALGSSVMISGPIATLHNSKGNPANLGFVVKRDAAWNVSLPPDAATTFLSNGFMNLWESYTMDGENSNVFTRSVDFGKEIQVYFSPAVGNYYPDSGDALKLTCIKANGKTTVYDYGKLAGDVQGDSCKSISLNVTKGKQTPTGPRFVVEVQTGAAGFNF